MWAKPMRWGRAAHRGFRTPPGPVSIATMDRRIKEARVVPTKVRVIVGVAVSIALSFLFALLYYLSPQGAILSAADLALLVIGLLIFWYSERQHVRIACVLVLLLAHLGLIGYAAYFIPNPGISSFGNTAMFAGFWLISYGWNRRVGTELHCIKCDYPHLDEPYCPECSADWTERHSLVRGARVRDIPCVTLGSLCSLLWIVFALGPFFSTIYSKRVPTSVLMRIASTPGGSATHFYELSRRTLSAGERDTLAAMLIDTRDRVGELDTSQERWLNDASTAGTIAPALVDRHLSGLYTLKLAAPTNARVGVPAQIDVIISTKSHSFLSGREMHLWLDGLWLGESRVSEPDKSWLTMAEVHNYVDESGDPMIPPPHITFTPTAAGRQTVKAVYWLAWFMRPVPASRAVSVPPPGAIWSKRIELSTTIDVQP